TSRTGDRAAMSANPKNTDNTVSKRVEANRNNAKRSCGPRTPEGKARSRMNSLKHGLTAELVVLPGEDPERLEARAAARKEELKPQGELQDYLVERAVHQSWQLDRIDRAIAAKLKLNASFGDLDRDQAETDEALDLGRQLFCDPRGPIALYPHGGEYRG